MNRKEVADAICAFIEKYHNDANKVKMPAWDFKIKQIFNVNLPETSLKEASTNLWTFEVTAEIIKTDSPETVPMREKVNMAGNADVMPYTNIGMKGEQPEVKLVNVTHIKKQNKN